ncbi:MAG: SUMF1/EgtB/PvdO family nonheme iron enzyme, partial [Rhodoferax sp.]
MPFTALRASPASIDSPDMRRAGRDLLSLALMDARNHTLYLLALYEQALDATKIEADESIDVVSPAWLAGHVGWFPEFWIARNTQRGLGSACPHEPTRLGSIEPHADRWWNPQQRAAADRWGADLPSLAAARTYMLDTLEGTLELLDKASDEDHALYFYRLALFHEDQRGEQLITMAQTLGVGLPIDALGGLPVREPLLVPATRWMLGSPDGGFVFDNEKTAHEVAVPEFEIDAQPVTWAQLVEFVDDGGYDRPELWQPKGWD